MTTEQLRTPMTDRNRDLPHEINVPVLIGEVRAVLNSTKFRDVDRDYTAKFFYEADIGCGLIQIEDAEGGAEIRLTEESAAIFAFQATRLYRHLQQEALRRAAGARADHDDAEPPPPHGN
jgi:hypothetical protein